MIFKDHVSRRNTGKHIGSIQCFRVSAIAGNIARVTRCFIIVFLCFACFPLKGAADVKHVTSCFPFGDGRRP